MAQPDGAKLQAAEGKQMMLVSSYPAYVGSTNPYDQAIDSIASAVEARTAEFLFGAGMSKP